MQNPNSVMTAAFDGNVTEIANELGLTNKRIYHILGTNDPYSKLWRLLNPLGRVAPNQLRIIQADFNARCTRLFLPNQSPSTTASLHKEVSEAITAILAKAPKEERKIEILQAISELQKELEKCD